MLVDGQVPSSHWNRRYIIYSMLKLGKTQKKITEIIDVHKSTINQEFKRNRGGKGYRFKQLMHLQKNDTRPNYAYL